MNRARSGLIVTGAVAIDDQYDSIGHLAESLSTHREQP